MEILQVIEVFVFGKVKRRWQDIEIEILKYFGG